jgi:hypothetical protein
VPFIQRVITVTVQLAPNPGTNQPSTFLESGTDTVVLSDGALKDISKQLRTSVRVQNSGSPADGRAEVKVWGMTPSLMNQLSTLGLVFNLVPKNKLTIAAGDAKTGLTSIFTGIIQYAYADYSAQPSVAFIFDCLIGLADAVVNSPPSSFPGSQDVASIMSGIARQMNVGFQNFGVNVKLSNVYLEGSLKRQADKLARQARITWGFVNPATMGIWPLGKGGNLGGAQVPVISKATGMITSPSFTQQGIMVKTLFNPLIAFNGLVQVESSVLSGIAAVQAAKGNTSASSKFPTQWAVNKLDLALDAQVEKGDWASILYAYNPNFAPTILPPAGPA